MAQENEIWEFVFGYPNYMVSNNGKIKSLKKEINRGHYKSIQEERIITNKSQSCGYLSVTLSNEKGKKRFLIHRLVAEAFLKKMNENQIQVNHKNGIKTDNRTENLEWVTVSDNHKHAFRVLKKQHPKFNLGKTGYLCKISKEIECTTLSIRFGSIQEAKRELGIDSSLISKVCKGIHRQAHGLVFRYI